MGLGLPAPEFWAITLREADVILRASADRQVRAKRIEDGRTYTLAGLISYAVNDPRNMPRFDRVFPDGKPKKQQTPAEMWAAMKGWAQAMKAAEAARNG